MKRNLNFSYSLYQSLYWMSACFVYSYTRVFLQKLGFSASVAGAELAFSSILSVLLQPWIASALGKRKSLSLRSVITGALVTAATGFFLPLPYGQAFMKGACPYS